MITLNQFELTALLGLAFIIGYFYQQYTLKNMALENYRKLETKYHKKFKNLKKGLKSLQNQINGYKDESIKMGKLMEVKININKGRINGIDERVFRLEHNVFEAKKSD